MPTIYGNSSQIVQGPGYVAITYEMIHDTRIIPLTAAQHLGNSIRSDFGDSRGHWEGDTLVVETTNFLARSVYRNANPERLKITERFTRVGPNTLNYEITVNDPTVWTKPWTAMVPFQRTDEAIYEYACHEGNYRSMEGSLKGTRVLEQEATGTGQTTTSRQRQ